MMKVKIFLLSCVMILAVAPLTCFGSDVTPRNVDEFVSLYNDKIKLTTAARVSDTDNGGYYAWLDRCSIQDMTTYSDETRRAKLFYGKITFASKDFPQAFAVMFAFPQNISPDTFFAIMEATVMTTGEDFRQVMQALGIREGNSYSIPDKYDKEVTFGSKRYKLMRSDEQILFMAGVM